MSETRIETTRSHKRRRGLTLVEIMISLVVLAFGLLGVAALQVRAITESSGGQHLSSASAIARNRVEELNRTAWNAVTLNDTASLWAGTTAVTAQDQTYSRAERITNNGATAPLTTIKAIEVRVQWSDNKRQNRSVVFSSARLREPGE